MNHQFKSNKQDEYLTPACAIEPLLKYIDVGARVWCPFDKPNSNFVGMLGARCDGVTHSHIDDGLDFFTYQPDAFDVIVSNPPYSKRDAVIERLFDIGKPFAMLINMAGLFDSKKRFDLLSTNRFEIMVLDRRVNYIREGVQLAGVPFKSIFLCSDLLPDRFMFEAIDKKQQEVLAL